MDDSTLMIAMAAFRRAVGLCGGQKGFERRTGMKQQTVSNRLAKNIPLQSDEEVLLVEAATKVSRHELRPDLYPPEPAPPAGSSHERRPGPSGPAKAGGGAPVPHAPGHSDPADRGTCDRSATLHHAREALA